MALILTEEKYVLWKTSLDAAVPTLGAGQGLVADAVLAAGAAGVHEAIPAPDLGQGPAARAAPVPGLAANPAPGLGESLTPNPQQSLAPGSQSLGLARVHRNPALAPMRANLAPRVAPKQSRREIPEAAPKRSLSVRSPEAALLHRGRMEMERGRSQPLVHRPLKRIVISRSHPANALHLALLLDQSLVPVLGLPLKTSLADWIAQQEHLMHSSVFN